LSLCFDLFDLLTPRQVELGMQEQQVFRQNLLKAELKMVKVSINQDANMDVKEILVMEVIVNILKLQDNSTFMGVPKGMLSIMVFKFYDELWKIVE